MLIQMLLEVTEQVPQSRPQLSRVGGYFVPKDETKEEWLGVVVEKPKDRI
jgi:hypothetical protein